MGTSCVDGVVEAAEVKCMARGAAVFRSIRFRLDDGSVKTVTNAVIKQEVVRQMKPGDAGRFFLFTGVCGKGVCGVRKSDGTEVFAFPGNSQDLFVVLAIASLTLIALHLLILDRWSVVGFVLLTTAAVCSALVAHTAREAKAKFAADGSDMGVALQTSNGPNAQPS